jgi:hypothetical protein
MNKHPLQTHQRQVHLDFHTSPFIPDVGRDFDAAAFAETFQRAHVNSVTVFAKCHHGMCYYPARTGPSHPAIGDRDLLGEQIEALHRLNIRAPIYTTVVWEEHVAQNHPEWRQMTIDGRFAEDTVGPDAKAGHHAMWKFNNFLDPEYQDFFEAHLVELLDRYGDAVDGFFIDILFFHPRAGWSDASRAFRAKHGLLENTPANFAVFQGLAQAAFSKRFTHLIHSRQSRATVFYNAQNDGNLHPNIGPRARAEHQTHFEIESLPSGFWGYFHFPRMGRMQSHWGKPWLGMTGRFQKMWGDFGGVKPQAALEFECFRAQALGGANSIGDQLPPRGILDPAAYDLIGKVYEQCEAAEAFYEGAGLLANRVAVLTPSSPGVDAGLSEEAAVLLCEEHHYDCAVIDSQDDFNAYSLILLPDQCVITPELAEKLAAYYKQGGKLLISHKALLDSQGKLALDFLPLQVHGDEPLYPTFWRAEADFNSDLAVSDRVVYSQGLRITPKAGAEVCVHRVLPYFKRSDLKYSSHFQTPPVAEADPDHPAVIRGERFVVFADPIFYDLRKTGNPAVAPVWAQCMEALIGPPPFGKALSKRILQVPLRKGDDLLLTLLHYIPVRKALDIDVIDEASSFAAQRLHLDGNPPEVIVFGDDTRLQPDADGAFPLPARNGRLLLQVPNYFA